MANLCTRCNHPKCDHEVDPLRCTVDGCTCTVPNKIPDKPLQFTCSACEHDRILHPLQESNINNGYCLGDSGTCGCIAFSVDVMQSKTKFLRRYASDDELCGCQCNGQECHHGDYSIMADGRCSHCGYDYKQTSIPRGAIDAKILADGRRAVLYETLFGARFLIGPADDDTGGDEEYMFDDRTLAEFAFNRWDGYGEPHGWIRHSVGNQIRRQRNDGTIEVEQHAPPP